MAYRHDGFFHAMDTHRDYEGARTGSGIERSPPWKVWGEGRRPTWRSFWRDRPTFVTGATGLRRRPGLRGALLDAGSVPTSSALVLRRRPVARSSCDRGLIDRVKLVRGDVRDQALIERALGEYEIETVFHLGAQTIVGIAQPQPGLDLSSRTSRAISAAGSLPPARPWSGRGRRRCEVVRQGVRRAATVLALRRGRCRSRAGILYDVSKSCSDLDVHSYAVTPWLAASPSPAAATSTAAAT